MKIIEIEKEIARLIKIETIGRRVTIERTIMIIRRNDDVL